MPLSPSAAASSGVQHGDAEWQKCFVLRVTHDEFMRCGATVITASAMPGS